MLRLIQEKVPTKKSKHFKALYLIASITIFDLSFGNYWWLVHWHKREYYDQDSKYEPILQDHQQLKYFKNFKFVFLTGISVIFDIIFNYCEWWLGTWQTFYCWRNVNNLIEHFLRLEGINEQSKLIREQNAPISLTIDFLMLLDSVQRANRADRTISLDSSVKLWLPCQRKTFSTSEMVSIQGDNWMQSNWVQRRLLLLY